jgi:murein DD-endopeptidase MepM/ murein hydrolase activator NlpD
MYKYRDADGQWVYTDRKPDTSVPTEELTLGPGEAMSPRIVIEQVRTSDASVLRAVNDCACPVEFGLKITAAENVSVPGNGVYSQTVPPRSALDLVVLPAIGVTEPSIAYDWGYVIGEPNAEHRPSRAYRVPFAVARSFLVSQAYPSTYTHGDPASRHAVDIAMPEGTAIYAARGGIVIDVAHGNFKSGIDRTYADKANFVRVLHDDGTFAIYAHLRWDSIRVRPGQRVERGEFIAASGNTGFSSGPHLHFAVMRNVGLRTESLPVSFEGPGGQSVTAREGQALTAY